MRTIEQMINQEILCCVSGLVHTLAKGYGGDTPHRDMAELCEQAFELARPIDDWESAADDARFTRTGDGKCIDLNNELFDNAQDACEANNIDPHEREVYEHWAVTNWFADQLEAHGERVDRDFAGLTVWARTITGQAISMDSVVERIYREMMAA